MRRLPRPALRPFIQSLWALDETAEPAAPCSRREHVVPTGSMHLVFRLSDDPLRLYEDDADAEGELLTTAVVGGARSRFYVREVSRPLHSVGAQLRPGSALLLFGAPANELAERHTALEDLWGSRVSAVRDRLGEAVSLAERLDAFEELLAERLPLVRGLHPAVAQGLQQLVTRTSVHDVVQQSGYSHRRFVELFVDAVGLTPKAYSRVQRFRRALERASTLDRTSWTDIAADAGYSDQSHFNREFRECVGVTPTEYRKLAPRFRHHVPVGGD
jgi:AraC-like DNA-binding protein